MLFLFLFLPLLSPTPASAQTTALLNVPFTSEIPDGKWVGPWKNGCEEASIVMVEQYYFGKTNLSKSKAKAEMTGYFNIENRIFGQNANTNATETAKLINEYAASFGATVKDNPTLDEIKKELLEGRPVITLNYGFELRNPLINFARNGSYYHMMVLVGYDDEKQEFVVNDDGNDKSGQNFRYGYNTIMRSLNDYVHRTRKTNGTPRVLFTFPRLAKLAGRPEVYRVEDNGKRYITHPRVFKNHGWSWHAVRAVSKEWLESLTNGEVLK